MAIDRPFVEAFIQVMGDADWVTTLAEGELSNPILLAFTNADDTKRYLLHARRVTRQATQGDNPGTHNRPEGEMHMQLIFDGDQRGKGSRNQLRTAPDSRTLLWGFEERAAGYIVVAYDPDKHADYAYSASLQVKSAVLDEAERSGIAFQTKGNGETVVAFPLSNVLAWLDFASEFYALNVSEAVALRQEPEAPESVQRALSPVYERQSLPTLSPSERERTLVEAAVTFDLANSQKLSVPFMNAARFAAFNMTLYWRLLISSRLLMVAPIPTTMASVFAPIAIPCLTGDSFW